MTNNPSNRRVESQLHSIDMLRWRGDTERATKSLYAIIESWPTEWRAWSKLAKIYIDRSEVAQATQVLDSLYELRRKEGLGREYVNGTWLLQKLSFDLAQAQYLVSSGKKPINCQEQIGKIGLIIKKANCNSDGSFKVSCKEIEALDDFYSSLRYMAHPGKHTQEAAIPFVDKCAEAAERILLGHEAVVVIDNFLSPTVLRKLRAFCLESTIWHELRNTNDYIGAYFDKGFCSPSIVETAALLSKSFSRISNDCRLEHVWAYSYKTKSNGIGAHADFAKLNLNFWITPDGSNLDKKHGGLSVFDWLVPPSWDFNSYNFRSEELRKTALQASRGLVHRIPYRHNRAVLFDSRLVHETDNVNFRYGYVNRRLNVTMLFGRRIQAKTIRG